MMVIPKSTGDIKIFRSEKYYKDKAVCGAKFYMPSSPENICKGCNYGCKFGIEGIYNDDETLIEFDEVINRDRLDYGVDHIVIKHEGIIKL